MNWNQIEERWQLYHRAVQATSQQEADAFLDLCTLGCQQDGRSREDARRLALDYIGYYACTYYEESVRDRACLLYGTARPLRIGAACAAKATSGPDRARAFG